MKDLPIMFNSFSEARKEGFIELKEAKKSGEKVVGTYCVFTPWELIVAAGAIPVSLCGMSNEPIQEAEKYLPRNLCPLIKSSYGFATSDTCPYFYFADLLVGETTCDGKKKMYEYLQEIKPMHIMQLPQTNKGHRAYLQWKEEMLLLKKTLENTFNVKITNNKLKEAIINRNKERKLLKEFYQLNTLCPPPMSGMEMLKVLYGSGFKIDKTLQKQHLREIIDEVKNNYENGYKPISSDKKRILITGCPIGGDTEKIIKIIEESGGVVVCFENCSGVKGHNQLVDETKEPIDALTEKYINIACSCISPNDNRIKLLSHLVEEYKVDGVIDVILHACHTYSVENLRIKRTVLNEKNTPCMSIETDYSQSDIGQLRTRISAFIELL